MGNAIVGENSFLLYSLFMGIFITFIYDLIRIMRRVINHNIFFISLEDILFWIFCGISVFYMMHTQSNGTLRWFAVLGALAGMLLYMKTVSRLLVKWVSKSLNWVKEKIGKALHIFFTPARAAGRQGIKAAHYTVSFGRKIRVSIKKRLTAFLKMLKMILCKQ